MRKTWRDMSNDEKALMRAIDADEITADICPDGMYTPSIDKVLVTDGKIDTREDYFGNVQDYVTGATWVIYTHKSSRTNVLVVNKGADPTKLGIAEYLERLAFQEKLSQLPGFGTVADLRTALEELGINLPLLEVEQPGKAERCLAVNAGSKCVRFRNVELDMHNVWLDAIEGNEYQSLDELIADIGGVTAAEPRIDSIDRQWHGSQPMYRVSRHGGVFVGSTKVGEFAF